MTLAGEAVLVGIAWLQLHWEVQAWAPLIIVTVLWLSLSLVWEQES